MHVALQRTISSVVPSNQHEGVSLLLHPKANILFCDSNIFVVSLHTADNLAFDSLVGRPLFVNPQSKIVGPQSKIAGPQSKIVGPQSKIVGYQSKIVGPQPKISGY